LRLRARDRRRRALYALASLFLPLAVAGCLGGGRSKAGGEAAGHVTVVHMENGNGEAAILAPYAEAVARLSGGSLQIQIGRNAHAGDADFEEKIIRDVQTGKAELGWVGARAWDSVGVHSFDALLAPFLIQTYSLQQRVLESDLSGRMLAGLGKLDLVGIGILPGPMRRLLGVRETFNDPADFADATIGIQRSLVAARTFRTLKAKPVAVPTSADIAQLDGYEQQLGSIFGNRYFLDSKSVTTNATFWPRPLVLFTSRSFFASLSPSQRQELLAAAKSSIGVFSDLAESDDRTGVGGLCRAGFSLESSTSPELAALRGSVRPVYQWLERDPETRFFIRRIEAMRQGLATPTPPACPSSTASSTAPSPEDGVYRMTTTAKEVAQHDDVPTSQATPENYGDFVLVVDRGRFAFTQQNKLACTWQYGRIRIEGDRMMWEFTNGGGIAPTNAENKPGELFVWRWNLFRDVLSLHPITPTDLTTETWRRVTSTPSAEYLARRCPPPADALP
jgi:TRAP-type C4-dicarboxylate transport system substrate-binding protein